MQGLTEPFYFNIVGYCNFTEARSRGVCAVLRDKGLFVKNWTTLARKTLRLPLEYVKCVDLDYRSSLSVAWMVRLWFESLQSLTVYAQPLVEGNLYQFSLWRTHRVPLFTCSLFCSYSLCNCFAVSRSAPLTVPHSTYPVTFICWASVPSPHREIMYLWRAWVPRKTRRSDCYSVQARVLDYCRKYYVEKLQDS